MLSCSFADLPVRSVLLVAVATVAVTMVSGRAVEAPRGQAGPASGVAPPISLKLESVDALELVRVKGEVVNYRGRRAVHIADELRDGTDARTVAILTGSDFTSGTISIDVAGSPRSGATEDVRGFVGVAFRIQPHGSQFECVYLRMTNGRADDPIRRRHVVQYISYPDFPFSRLRRERPGVYEAYADVEPGAWIPMKIVVAGTRARLYLHGAEQPVLEVHDLKLGESRGQIGLWVGPETDGYFSNLMGRR